MCAARDTGQCMERHRGDESTHTSHHFYCSHSATKCAATMSARHRTRSSTKYIHNIHNNTHPTPSSHTHHRGMSQRGQLGGATSGHSVPLVSTNKQTNKQPNNQTTTTATFSLIKTSIIKLTPILHTGLAQKTDDPSRHTDSTGSREHISIGHTHSQACACTEGWTPAFRVWPSTPAPPVCQAR